MPFTLSHPAAVVPLRHLRLPIAALACGSMVPDIPLFLPGWSYDYSHSLLGLVTIDLVMGLLVTLLWWTVLRAPFVDALPAWARSRMPAGPTPRLALAALVPVAVLLGGLTHVGWDELTHEGRWGERHVPWLAAKYDGIGGVHWAQAASSVLGLAAVVWTVGRTLKRAAATPRPARVTGFGVAAWSAVLIAGIVAALMAVATSTGGLHAAAIAAAELSVPAAVASAALAAAAWWAWSLAPRR